MDKAIEFFNGKKTYIIAAVTAGLAFADAMGWPVPVYVFAVLASLGLTTGRAGATKDAKVAAE